MSTDSSHSCHQLRRDRRRTRERTTTNRCCEEPAEWQCQPDRRYEGGSSSPTGSRRLSSHTSIVVLTPLRVTTKTLSLVRRFFFGPTEILIDRQVLRIPQLNFLSGGQRLFPTVVASLAVACRFCGSMSDFASFGSFLTPASSGAGKSGGTGGGLFGAVPSGKGNVSLCFLDTSRTGQSFCGGVIGAERKRMCTLDPEVCTPQDQGDAASGLPLLGTRCVGRSDLRVH